jgi:hypothetical protein
MPMSALSAGDAVPPTVDGVKTDVIETGEIVAFQIRDKRCDPRDRA